MNSKTKLKKKKLNNVVFFSTNELQKRVYRRMLLLPGIRRIRSQVMIFLKIFFI